jgi:hypothetical protein
MTDCVAKLDNKLLARNNRIMAHKVLHQHCARASGLESTLLALASKIVLQHNRPQAEVVECPLLHRYCGTSGHQAP